jgi:hypothetical protein
MRKIYTSLFAVALVTGVSAQHANLDIQPIRKNIEIGNTVKPGNIGQVKGATVWSNDFSNPADWTMTNSSNPSLDWVVETDVNAAPRTEFQPVGMTSASNGFIFIDSDAAGQTATQNADATLATAIDMTTLGTTATNFSLVFEHCYRSYQDTRIVRVSGDGGTTWTDFTLTDGTDANTNTNNPEISSFNISSIVAPGGVLSNNVLIQFNYQGAWGWFWAVDDVSIVETDDNDLKLDLATFGSMGTWGATLPYYQVPVDQIAPVTYWGVASNIGAVDQTNTAIDVDVNSGTFTGSSAAGFTSVVGSTDTLTLTADYTPASATGTHTAAMDLGSDNTDADASNNSGTVTFDVTDYIYARDNGVIGGGSFNSGEAYEVGNIFDIVTTADLSVVNVTVASTSGGAPLIYAKLYSIDAGTGDFIFMEQSDDYALDASEFGTEVELCLLSTQTLNAGESYLVVVGAYGDGGASNDLVTATGGDSEAQTTFYFDGTDQTWYYTTSTPMVRMNFDPAAAVCAVSVEEVPGNVTVGQNYPNPFNGNTTVNYSLVNTDEVMVEITDLTGKVIAVMNEGVRTAGEHTVEINSNGLAAGTYYYSIITSNGKVTKAMNVAK